ncbi:MAG: hypothetical protein ACI4FZ_10155 [Lachnospiraceae bacterium]
MDDFPLQAVVYYSVQETETHYFVGYYFYHPRDDAEIWLDKHENDMEGIMLAVRKEEDSFGKIELMYTQGHGYVPFYFDSEELSVTEGSRKGGGLLISGHHPVIYITPNGTLSNAGHSVESAKDHSLYWSVFNSGVRYYYGGVAEEPATFKGSYENNPCSYDLVPLDVLWNERNGEYGSGHLFAEYGAFCGDNYGKNAANPPWGWRNKTVFGYGGSFLSDPAWTIVHAVSGLENFSQEYLSNPYADWEITIESVTLQKKLRPYTEITAVLYQGPWRLSGSDWWSTVVTDAADTYEVSFGATNTIYVAAPKDTVWTLEAETADGTETLKEEAELNYSVRYLPKGIRK